MVRWTDKPFHHHPLPQGVALGWVNFRPFGAAYMETGTTTNANPKPKLRWYHPTPGRVLFFLLLGIEGVLLLSEQFHWFAFNEKKGWTVLIAIASVGVTMILMFLWFILALLFRWRFQFSIRSLLVLTIALAVPCSWLTVEMKWAEKQRKAVKALTKIDRELLVGVVVYDDFRYSTLPPLTGGDRLGSSSSWLRKMFGDDFFSDATSACLFGDKLTDTELDHLKELNQLQDLYVYGVQLIDSDLVRLEGLKQLHYLILKTKVTDDGVAKLQKALPKCEIQR